MSDAKTTRGFTLIELCIVLVLGGLLAASLADGYRVYLAGQKIRMVNEQMLSIKQMLSAFASKNGGRFPCPADPALPSTSPLAGVENCLVTGGVKSFTGAYDANNDGSLLDDQILQGAIPYATLLQQISTDGTNGLSLHNINANTLSAAFAPTTTSLDPWGRKIIYAVTKKITTAATAGTETYGTINVQTEGGVPLLNPANTAAFVILSAGENGMGAYTKSGTIAVPCIAGQTDAENCNNDSKFISGLRNLGTGAAYFDDILYFTSLWRALPPWTSKDTTTPTWAGGTVYAVNATVSHTNGGGNILYYTAILAHTADLTNEPGVGALWSAAWSPLATTPPQKTMYNTSMGKVGIGTSSPGASLEVSNPNLSGAIQSTTAGTQQICDTAGSECFDPVKLGGTGIACPVAPPGSVAIMTGIAKGQAQCLNIPVPGAINFTACPAGQLMYGINAAGNPMCKVP
jgi:prepilin-type N-terminal cleavage/methylation domain-containing protein